MADITEYMKQLGITPALFQKWQQEDVEADEPAPFQTHRDALILAQRRQAAREEAAGPIKEVIIEVTETAGVPVVSKEARVVEEVVVGRSATDHIEIVHDTVRRTNVEVEQAVERERARGR